MIIREVADPLSTASLRGKAAVVPGSFIESDALDVLATELSRYCNQEIVGRSFLISGHRGAGKTTIVQHAFRRALDGARAGNLKLRPLYVHLHGPSLFPDAGRAVQQRTASPAATPLTDGPPASDSIPGVTAAAARLSSIGPPAVPPSAETSASGATHDARIALEQITLALHRAASREFADGVWRRASELSQAPRRDAGFVEKMLWSATVSRAREGEFAELAAAFEYELQECPSPARLRDFWARFEALHTGILPPLEPGKNRNVDWVHGQGMRELVALSSVCDAHRRIAGELKQTDSASDDATHKLEAAISSDTSGSPFATLAASMLTGAIVGGGLALSNAGGAKATLAGLLSALGSSLVFRWSTSHARSRALKRNYEFVRDTTIATLDRQLPVLLERLLAAGLAPVFVVDELDKVDDLSERIFGMVRHLKKLVAESAFFCFLTDRAYFEEMRSRGEHRAYPLEYSYFTHRLFVSNTADSLHRYLGYMLDEASDAVEYPLLRYMLLHRSEMHALELHRLLRSLRKPNGEVGLDLNELRRRPSYRIDIALQLGVEIVLDDDDLRDRTRDEPDFQRLVHDALLYPSRKWADGQAVIEFSPETREDFSQYLIARMNRTEASGFIERRRRGEAGRPSRSRQAQAEAIDEGDLDTLWAKVQELVALLSENSTLEQRFGDWNSRRASRGMTPVDRTVAEQALGAGNSPFVRDSEALTRFKWRYDRYGVDQVRRTEQANREAATARMRDAIALIENFSHELARAQAPGQNQPPVMDALDFEALIDTYRILPTSRGWSSVQDSMRTLAGRSLGETADRSLDDHAQNVEAFAAMIGANAELIGYALACTMLLTRVVPRSATRLTQLQTGSPTQIVLARLSSMYGFRSLSTNDVLARFRSLWGGLRAYPGKVDDHLGKGPAPRIRKAVDVRSYFAWLEDSLRIARASTLETELAAPAAWSSLSNRYFDDFMGRAHRSPAVAELLCAIGGVAPFSEFSIPLDQTPAATWVRILSPALFAGKSGSGVSLPPWVHGLAAHALGFRSTSYDETLAQFCRLAGVPYTDHADDAAAQLQPRFAEASREIRKFMANNPALLSRPASVDLITVLKRESSVVDSWAPSTKAAIIALSPMQLASLGDSMAKKLITAADRHTLAIEFPADAAVSSTSLTLIMRQMHISISGKPTFKIVNFGAFAQRPTDVEGVWVPDPRDFDQLVAAVDSNSSSTL